MGVDILGVGIMGVGILVPTPILLLVVYMDAIGCNGLRNYNNEPLHCHTASAKY